MVVFSTILYFEDENDFHVFLWMTSLIKATNSKNKTSQVYFTTRLKVRRQETAIRPSGHLGQLHLLAILYSYMHKLNLVMEPPKNKK